LRSPRKNKGETP